MVVGSREPLGKKIITYLAGQGGTPEAGVAGSGFRSTVENAAWAHGTFAHASELEDDEFFPTGDAVGNYWVHPALFPLAEKLMSSGREFVEALVVSSEVASRLAEAAPMFGRRRGQCTPAWIAPVAVAGAAARFLDLSVDQTENALSIAASHCTSLADQLGFDIHFLEAGHSCRAGILSALMAKEGATGQPNIIGKPEGLYSALLLEEPEAVNFDVIMNNLGKPPFRVHNLEIKKFSACNLTHSAVDALTMLVKENDIKHEDVDRVDVEVNNIGAWFCDRPFPDKLSEARFSYSYLLGEVLLRGQVDYGTFIAREKLTDPKFHEIQSKIKVILREDWEAGYKGARVTVVKKDGEQLVKHLDAFTGHPSMPLSLEQIRDVCRSFLGAIMREDQLKRVEDLCLNVEKLADIRELMNILTYFTNPIV